MNSVTPKQFSFKQGDTRDQYAFVLRDDFDKALDLTGASVVVYMANKQGVVVEKDAVITDAANGGIYFSLDDGNFTGTGALDVEFVVTHANGEKETFPEVDYIKATVLPSLRERGDATITLDGGAF